MKRHIIFISIFLFALCSEAHGYTEAYSSGNDSGIEHRPFIEERKQWTVISADFRVYWVKTYYISSDTIIGDYACKKLMCRTMDYLGNESVTELHFCIFEEDGKVCYFPLAAEDGSAPIVLYDFRASPGDTLSLGGHRENENEMKCYQVWKELTLENGNEKFLGQLATIYDSTLSDVNENSRLNLYEWYEGIGSIFHPFEKTFFNLYMGGVGCWLYECKVADHIIYSNKRGLEIDFIDDIKTALSPESSTPTFGISDLQGRQLQDKPERGVYIQDGRKVVIK